MKSRQVSLSTTATLIATGQYDTPSSPAKVLVAQPSATVYLGGSDVTTTNGIELSALDTFSTELVYGDELYAIASSGTPTVQVFTSGRADEVS